MKITLYEYKRLPEKQQHSLVHTEGDFIELVMTGNHRYLLFGLSSFYVELTYCVVSNKIINLTSFRQGEILDKYMKI
ncbi:hypothetical protein [Salinimicrobium xinjiangense]|uniref:hypothetical protein n=1 Tax=Salinimicrobium xinjiangense TaxID=438596 RepID=UPI000491040E|nr:hypothetical protein [Salinimicrobium xinjiangense]